MGDRTKIEWAGLGLPRGATWNPIIAINKETDKRGWFCVKKNSACANCYAERMNRGAWGNGLRFSVSDLARVRNAVMDTIDEADWHRFGLLTKRADKSTLDYLVDRYTGRSFPRHVWFGISIGNQAHADETLWFMQRLRELVGPDVVLWVSYEPSIGPVDWSGWELIDWLVAGGESGPRARPMHPDWARAGRDWCAGNGIAFYFKQWGQWSPDLSQTGLTDFGKKDLRERGAGHVAKGYWCFADGTLMHRVRRKEEAGRLLDGRERNEYPVPIDAEADVI